jgi:phospholipid/cholesterol/gamma-HCH transport system substrate-binding protein
VLAPDLRRFFRDLDPLITASRTGLPAGSEVLRGLKPTLAELTPFLAQINPILQYLEASQFQVSDFITNGAAALADTEPSTSGGVGHYLRQFGPLGAESAAIYKERLPSNRGETYVGPQHLFGPEVMQYLDAPSTDCANTGGAHPPSQGNPGCWKADGQRFQGRIQGDFPHIQAENYLSPSAK